jgi:hypothetical protein
VGTDFNSPGKKITNHDDIEINGLGDEHAQHRETEEEEVVKS